MELSRLVLLGLLWLGTADQSLATTYTWDGGDVNDNNISSGDNWVGNPATVDSDLANTDLIFAGLTRLMPNLSASFATDSVTFTNTAGAFTFGGSTLSVGLTGIVNNDTNTMTFGNTVGFNGVASSTINAASGGLTFNSSVLLPASILTITGGSPTSFNNFSGVGTVVKEGAGTMTWGPSNPVNHDVILNAGIISTEADASADTFGSNSFLTLNTGTFNINEDLNLDGAQLTRASTASIAVAAGKTWWIKSNGTATITGAFNNSTDSTIMVGAAGAALTTTSTLTIGGGSTLSIFDGGMVSSGAGNLNIGTSGSGTVTVDGSSSSLSGGTLNLALSGNTGSLIFFVGASGDFAIIHVGDSAVNGSTGTLNIQGGSDVTGTGLEIAEIAAAATGTATVTGVGSTLTVTGAGTTGIGAASDSSGTLNVNSSGVFNSGTGLTTVNTTGEISINGGTFNCNGSLTLNGGLLTRGSTGTLAIDAGTTLTVQNGGDVTLDGDYTHANGSMISITGTGSSFASTNGNLFFFGGTQVSVLAGATLATPAGFLSLAGSNGGTLTVDGAGSTVDTDSSLLVGTISSSSADFLATFRNGGSGTLGSLSVQIGASNRTSHVQIESGATVSAASGSIGNQGIATASSSVTVTGASSALTYTGTVGTVSGGGTNSLNVQSSATCAAGNLTVNQNGLVAITGGIFNSNGNLTLTGGQLTRDATGVFALDASRILLLQAGADANFTGTYNFNTDANMVVTGAGSTFSATTLGLNNSSAISVEAGGALSVPTVAIGNVAATTGAITVTGSGSSLTATTSLSVGQNGGTGTLTFSNGSSGSIGFIFVDNSGFAGTNGTLNIQSGATVTTNNLSLGNGSQVNTGQLTITGASSALTVNNNSAIGAATNTSGMLTVESGGTLTLGNLTTVNVTGTLNINNGAVLTGTSDFAGLGPINIAGAYLPGAASGANQTTEVSFAQNMIFQPTTMVTMEIGGLTPGTQHDRLVFNGSGNPHITWNGTLNVMLINGFVPQSGQSFDLFNFDIVRDSGTFATVNLPSLPVGLFWRTNALYSTGQVHVSSVPATYAEWESAFAVTEGFNGDDDDDGIANGLEFNLGTNPKQPFDGGAPLIELQPEYFETHTEATVTFTIPALTANDARYRLYAAFDLNEWTLIASKDGNGLWTTFLTAEVSEGSVTNGFVPISVREFLAVGVPRFHRLEAAPP